MPRPLYGSHTRKALENFPVSGWEMPSEFIRVLALIKEHAARVNGELREISKAHAQAIAAAASLIKKGKHLDQFPVDVLQTGSGTSTNMNMNEVIAGIVNGENNEKGEMGKGKWELVHPNDHVNRGQSSNDIIPTAMQISVALEARDRLIPALTLLVKELSKKEKEFSSIIKIGRTHLMDAVPVRLGDEFQSYASLLVQAIHSVTQGIEMLSNLPLGGTAVGTGINAHPKFAGKVIAALAKETGLPLEETEDHIAAQSCPLAAKVMSSALAGVAIALTKMANDIRLMGSDCIGELILPALQAGSSIMPAKVNPVLCEGVEQVAIKVAGSDSIITQCLMQGSRFELNTCLPLIAEELLISIRLLTNVSHLFAEKCIRGIKANTKNIKDRLERSAMLATALAPEIGYEKAAEIAKEALKTGETILEVAARSTKIPLVKLKKLFDPNLMV